MAGGCFACPQRLGQVWGKARSPAWDPAERTSSRGNLSRLAELHEGLCVCLPGRRRRPVGLSSPRLMRPLGRPAARGSWSLSRRERNQRQHSLRGLAALPPATSATLYRAAAMVRRPALCTPDGSVFFECSVPQMTVTAEGQIPAFLLGVTRLADVEGKPHELAVAEAFGQTLLVKSAIVEEGC